MFFNVSGKYCGKCMDEEDALSKTEWEQPTEHAHVARSELLRGQFVMMTPGQRRRRGFAAQFGGLRVWLVLLILGFGTGFAGLHAMTSVVSHAKDIKEAANRDAERQRDRTYVSNERMRSFWARQF
jgi:hypothetical protein